MKTDDSHLDQNLKLIVRTSLIVLIGLFLAKLLSYAYRIIMARYFGPEVYGIYSLAIMVMGWFMVISTLGLTQGIIRYISFYRGKNQLEEIRQTVRVTFSFLTWTGLISGAILFFSSSFIANNIFHNADLVIFLKIFSFVIPITILMNACLSILQAFEKISLYSFIFNFLQNFLRVFFILLLIYLGLKTNAILFSYLLSIALSLLIAYIFCTRIPGSVFKKTSLSKEKKRIIFQDLFSYSWPLLFFGLIESVFYWTDSFMIGYFQSATEVGLYNAALPIVMLLTLTSEMFMQLFFPLITKEYSKNNLSLIKQLSQQVEKWILMINLPAFMLLILFPGTFINVLFGSEYLPAATALRFLAVGSLFASLFIICSKLISVRGKSKIILKDIVLIAIINAVLDYFLVKSYGMEGAAIATMISLVLLNILFLLQAHKYMRVSPLRFEFVKIFIASAIPTFIIFFARRGLESPSLSWLFIFAALYGLVYLIILIVFGCFDNKDLLVLNAIKNKLNNKKL